MERGPVMKTTIRTSLRLALTALAVSGITFAASGKPLPFLAKAQPAELWEIEDQAERAVPKVDLTSR